MVNFSFMTLGKYRPSGQVVGVHRSEVTRKQRAERPQRHYAHLMIKDKKNRRWECVGCGYHRTERQVQRHHVIVNNGHIVIPSEVSGVEKIDV